MSDKKLLVVFGATGVQGGSVINSVLGDPKTAETFKIRGVTRDTSKDAAKALVSRGVEVVAVSNSKDISNVVSKCKDKRLLTRAPQANTDDKESLRGAIKGAYAVFSLTNFWDHMDPVRERTQGINVADVAAVSALK